MLASFALCGVAMIVIGCCFADKFNLEDLSKTDAAKTVAKTSAKGAVKAGSYAVENQHLLNDA